MEEPSSQDCRRRGSSLPKINFGKDEWKWPALLVFLGVSVWMRAPEWRRAPGETLPLLAALPLFFWLGAPWPRRQTPVAPEPKRAVSGLAACGLGIGLDLLALAAAGWTLLLAAWLEGRVDPEAIRRRRVLFLLPLLAFPWVSHDFANLGWWFRISGAAAAAKFFGLLGVEAAREGTLLEVGGARLAVAPACAGLGALQAMGVAGAAAAYLTAGSAARLLPTAAALFLLAWAANTLRIIALAAVAAAWGTAAIEGWVHLWGGWLVLMMMFLLTMGFFGVWARLARRGRRRS